MVAFFRRRQTSWEYIRGRMLRETEMFLEESLADPKRQVTIPVVRVGEAEFVRGFADMFWAGILGSS
jgi:hypothetical protein